MARYHELGVVQARLDILLLQLGMFGEYLFGGHSRPEHVDDHLNRPAHTTNARLAMANSRVDGDTAEMGTFHGAGKLVRDHEGHDPKTRSNGSYGQKDNFQNSQNSTARTATGPYRQTPFRVASAFGPSPSRSP